MNKNLLSIFLIRLLSLIFKEDCSREVRHYIGIISKMRKNNGLAYTIKYMKTVKLSITRYICGKPLYINDANVSIESDGWPTRFLFLKKFKDKNPRLLLTLLTYSRALVPNKKESNARVVKLNTITDPYKGKEYTIPKAFIIDFVKRFDLSSEIPKYSKTDHYLSVKGSPNGKSSYSSIWSVGVLSISQMHSLSYILGDFYNSVLQHYMKIKLEFSNLIDKTKEYSGKLSIVHDPELKERVIAMCDYTTQFTLRPIHNILLNKLRNIECDRTFTQDPLHRWSDNRSSYYSLDLSAATDRFPIKLQKKLIGIMFSDYHFSNHWASLLVSREYMYQGKPYTYSVGQPMGAYTSWAAFTLTHHLVVHWAAHLCGHSDFKDYIILGDDIVIKDNKIANKYITLMTRFGVDISMQKTHVSNDTYEFAKRWIHQGREISGLSLKGILSNIKSKHVVYMNIFNYFQRIPSIHVNLLHLMCELYKGLKIGNRIKSSNTIYRQLYDFHHAIRYSFGILTYEEIRNYFFNKIPIEEFIVPNESRISFVMKDLLSKGMVQQGLSMKKTLLRSFSQFEKVDLPKEFWPLKYGYLNHLDSLKDKVKGFTNNVYQLLDLISIFRVQSLDPILNFERNSHKNLITMDKLWNGSFQAYIKSLKEDLTEKPKMDLMSHIRSGNFLKSSYKSTVVNLKPWHEELHETLKRVEMEFQMDDLRNQRVERDPADYQNRWIHYFNECKRLGKKPDFNTKV